MDSHPIRKNIRSKWVGRVIAPAYKPDGRYNDRPYSYKESFVHYSNALISQRASARGEQSELDPKFFHINY